MGDDDDIKSDARFAHVMSDPKFRVMPKSRRKVKIDSRFRSVFSSEHFSHKTDIDKRGRPIFDVTKRNRHVMKRFYQLSDDDDVVKSESDQEVTDTTCKQQNGKKRKNKRSKVADDHDSKSLSETETPEVAIPQSHIPEEQNKVQTEVKRESCSRKKVKYVSNRRDKILSEKSASSEKDLQGSGEVDQEDSSNHTTDDDDEDDVELPEFSQEFVLEDTDIDHKWNELHTDAVAVVESTRRLAVCNMDWDFVRAQDLFVLFKSFVPDGGRVKSVTIYPSEFGKERMAEEARLGPREIREHKSQECTQAKREEQSGKKKKKATNQQQVKRVKKDVEVSQTEKLRQYQLNRLRYYFAVVDCDSVVTAETIYNECDGREYLLSSVRLDLRFIPDNMNFDDPPREMFSQEQSILEYEPNRFSSTALCQAKVDVTWDETEFDRLSRRMGSMQQKELESIVEDNKYADIIAPPESDSDQDLDDQPDWLKHAIDDNDRDREFTEEEKIAMYRQLLVAKLDDEQSDDEGDEKKKEEEKELVWQPGLKSSLVKRMEKKERKRENTGVVNDYLEKKREKKKKKKEDRVKKRTVNEKEQEDNFDNSMNQSVEAVTDHTQTKKKIKKQKMHVTEDKTETKNMADLELLVMDDDDDVKAAHTDKDKSSNKKNKKFKKKQKKKLTEVKDEFQLDVNDPRFTGLYTSHHFHIDPSSSQFKKTTNMAAFMNEQIKRRGHSGKSETVTGSKPGDNGEQSRSLSHALVESLKLKMKK